MSSRCVSSKRVICHQFAQFHVQLSVQNGSPNWCWSLVCRITKQGWNCRTEQPALSADTWTNWMRGRVSQLLHANVWSTLLDLLHLTKALPQVILLTCWCLHDTSTMAIRNKSCAFCHWHTQRQLRRCTVPSAIYSWVNRTSWHQTNLF